MKPEDRLTRDFDIMRAVRAGVDLAKIARQHRLTISRIEQIIKREHWTGPVTKAARKRPWGSRAQAKR